MDEILHGTSAMGDQAFKLSVTLMEKILEESTALFPHQVSRLFRSRVIQPVREVRLES
jgi:hypothetical protein